jgi:hypothetical protein
MGRTLIKQICESADNVSYIVVRTSGESGNRLTTLHPGTQHLIMQLPAGKGKHLRLVVLMIDVKHPEGGLLKKACFGDCPSQRYYGVHHRHGLRLLRRFPNVDVVDCPMFVPVEVRQTGTRGAEDGARKTPWCKRGSPSPRRASTRRRLCAMR